MADQNLGSASVEISANLGPLGPALDQARQIVATSMSEMQESVSSASEAIFTALETYGVLKLAEWGSQLFDLGRGAIETGARMQETATAVGLTAEQYQIFSYAAQQAGVDQEKFSQAMIFFSRNIGLITQGATTPAAKAFADLHAQIKTNEDGTVNYGATLTDFLTKLGKVSDSTRATADSMEAFGRSGGRMILVAKDLADNGFDAIAEKARAMGLVLSNETVEQSKQLEDQFKTLGTVVENDVIRGMVALAPQIQYVIDKVIALSGEVSRFITLTPNFDSLTKEQIALYQSGLAPALEEATDKLAALQKQQQQFSSQGQSSPAGLTDEIKKQLDLVQELGSKQAAAQAAMQRILHPDSGGATGGTNVTVPDKAAEEAAKRLQEQFDKATESIDSQGAAYGRLDDAIGQSVEVMRAAETANAIQAELDKFSGQLSAAQVQQIYDEVTARQEQKYQLEDDKKALEDFTAAQTKQRAADDAFLAGLEKAHTPLEKIQDDMDRLNGLFATGEISLDEYNQGLAGAWDQYTKLDEQAQKTANTLGNEVASAVARGASSFLDLATSTDKSKSSMQQMQSAALGLVQDLLKVVEQLFVLNPLINALKSALGDNAAPLPVGDLGGIESGVKKFFGFGDSSTGSDAAISAAGGSGDAGTDAAITDATSGGAFPDVSSAAPGLESMMGNLFESVGKDIMGGGGELMQGAEDLFGNIFDGLGSLVSGAGGELSGLFSGIGSLFGFASGGAFDVGGAGGVDSQLVQFKATPGEHVSVGQDRGPAPSGPPNVIINTDHKNPEVSAEMAPNGRDFMITIAERMAHDTRTGGPLGRAQKETWGLNRVPIQR